MTDMDRGGNPNRISGEGTEFERQGEEHLRMAVEDAGIGTWEVNLADGRNQLLCALAARLFGVACEALATYEDVLALLHPEDRQSTSNAIKRCIKEHGDSEFDYRVLRPDGTMCWLRQRSQVYSDQR